MRACLEQLGVRNIIIVTSEFHTRRARFIFRRVLAGSGIVSRIHPAYDETYWDVHWWRRRRWAKTFLEESLKLLWTGIEQVVPLRQLSSPEKTAEPESDPGRESGGALLNHLPF